MTVFPRMLEGPGTQAASAQLGALFVVSALGDIAVGERVGFGRRVGAVAARFGEFLTLSDETRTALAYAGLLHHVGTAPARVPLENTNPSDRLITIAGWDAPILSAHFASDLGFGLAVSDAIRWHREWWDGTGFPDQLRWHTIPNDAMVLGVARGFAALASDGPSGMPSSEAVVELSQVAGREFSPQLVRRFQQFVMMSGGEFDDAFAPPQTAMVEETAAFEVAARIVDGENPGRALRIGTLAENIARKIAVDDEEFARVSVVARLANGGSVRPAARDTGDKPFDPLSRLAREPRAAEAKIASTIVADAGPYAALGPALRAVHEWFDGTGLPDGLRADAIPLSSRIVSVALAFDDLKSTSRESPLGRLHAASGTQFDPAVVKALSEVLK